MDNPYNEKRTYRHGGERYVLADGIERGEPIVYVTIDLPQKIEIDNSFIRDLDGLLKEIAGIVESLQNHQ